MAKQVVLGASLKCTFGSLPCSLITAPRQVLPCYMTAATVMDFQPGVNISTFGMCNAPTNPAVIAAAAPVPCVPVITSPWTPGSPTVLIGPMPALNDISITLCSWAGVITVSNPGQATIEIP